jgi:hypothetical protein
MPPPAPVDWNAVASALGKTGTMQPDGVYKVSLPRSDLSVMVGSVQLKPALALGSWVGFTQTQTNTMLMGDLVLVPDEVNPVISALQAGGIEQTAVHNHIFNEQPPVMYMHIEGHGDAVALATTVHSALAQTMTPFTSGSSPPPTLDLNTAQLDQIMRFPGKNSGGVYQFSVPRSEQIMEAGMVIPNSMNLYTGLNFQPLGGGMAAITGDFVLLADEVNPVIRTLRGSGILVTALHSHMLKDDPHLFFMHFWATGDSIALAQGLRAALDQTNSVKSQQ